MGVAKNETEAVKWYRQAADQGLAKAQFNLALKYENGLGVAKDDAMAAQLYQTAAQQGYTLAQYNLAVSYANGKGVPQSEVEAVKWYRHAAERGYSKAQYNLGTRYAIGRGVSQNNVIAYALIRLASNQADPAAVASLKLFESKLTAQELSRGTQLAESMARPGQMKAELDAYENGNAQVTAGKPEKSMAEGSLDAPAQKVGSL